MLGEKIKTLRISKGLLQRHLAAKLDVDIAYISKMEHGEKPVSKNHLKRLSKLFDISEDELLTLWLADKMLDISKNEPSALKAIEVAQTNLINSMKRRNKQ